jgi:hypothetical protein
MPGAVILAPLSNIHRWSAVARGAVCRGLEGAGNGLVAVRLARKHYGTYASEPYIAGVHDPEDMYIDEFTGSRYAKAQMTWLIEKGERLPESTPKKVSIECACRFKTTGDRDFGAVLVGCDEDLAPKRYRDKSESFDVSKICRYDSANFLRCLQCLSRHGRLVFRA